jgi:hypothetical protein
VSLLKTTVWVKVECEHLAGLPVASLVAQALTEFVEAVPAQPSGKFESKDGLDVSWFVKQEAAKPAAKPQPKQIATEVEGAFR